MRSWTRGGVTYTFANERDAVDWEWFRGLIASLEYERVVGEPPPDCSEDERKARLAEIEARAGRS